MSIGGDWSIGESYTEVSSRGWFSRIMGALIGIPIGILLFLGSFVLLFWNEGRSVQTAKSLDDPAHQNALIHVSGKATTDEIIRDPQFPISSNALRFAREVKMFQWIETKKTQSRRGLGGGQDHSTEYSYSQGWADHPINSSAFKVQDGHRNPVQWLYQSWSGEAKDVTLGAFRLPTDLVRSINKFEPLLVDEAARVSLPEDLRDKIRVDNGHFYIGTQGGPPSVGDLSIEFRQVRPTEVSILSAQDGGTFKPYQTNSGDAISRLQLGIVSADAMFKAAERENITLTWAFRLLGFILMAAGMGMVLKPLAVFSDVIPTIGTIARFGNAFLAIGTSLVLSLATIAVGWISFRPAVGISVLALAGLVLFAFFKLAKSRRAEPAKAWTPTPGPV